MWCADLGTVMKKIATLESIPRNDDLNITGRAAKLMSEVGWGISPLLCDCGNFGHY